MAKTAAQKAKIKALRNARKDGKISGKEAKLLRGLGIPQSQIVNTKSGSVKVGSNAQTKPATTATKPAQNKALRQARNDGKISGKEATSLMALGIPASQIKKDKGGSVKVGAGAKKTIKAAAPTAPTAPPTSNIYKDAGNTATEAINDIKNPPQSNAQKVLAKAGEDGVIKAKEAERLLGLGIKMNDLKQGTEGVRINKGAQEYYRQNQKVGDYGRKSPGFDAVERGGGGGGGVWDGLLNKKEFRGLQEDMGNGIRYYEDDPDPDQGWTPGQTSKDINYDAYNRGDWKTVAKEVGIKNVNSPGDIQRLYAFLNNYESGNSNGNNNGNNNNSKSSGADRDSGEFNDIKDAIGEDIATSFDRADELDNKGIDTTNVGQDIIDDLYADLDNNGLGDDDRGNGGGGNGGGGNGGGGNGGGGGGGGGKGGGGGDAVVPAEPAANPYQDIIDGLIASNSDLTDYTQQLIDDNAVAQSGFEETLSAQAIESANALAGLNDLFTTSFTGINDQIAQQQTDFNTAQAFTQQQLLNANNAFLAEQQRSANLQNAYVPGANPNALSIGYGDNRNNKKRQEQDNSLSDLTLLSGLGTQSNPLAGLQLA